jgi:hypothetical protein
MASRRGRPSSSCCPPATRMRHLGQPRQFLLRMLVSRLHLRIHRTRGCSCRQRARNTGTASVRGPPVIKKIRPLRLGCVQVAPRTGEQREDGQRRGNGGEVVEGRISEHLKIQKTFLPDTPTLCSFYLPVSMSRNDPVSDRALCLPPSIIRYRQSINPPPPRGRPTAPLPLSPPHPLS